MNKTTAMMRRFDVTVCLQNYPGIQWTIEVDAVGEEEACEFARWYFSAVLHRYVTVTTITTHRHSKTRPVTIMVNLKEIKR